MNPEQALKFIERIAFEKDAPHHKYYEHVCKLAEFYKIIITGHGADSLLRKYAKRQTDDDFNGLKEIYTTITPALADPIIKTYHKVFRVAPKVSKIDWEDMDAQITGEELRKRLDEIKNVLDRFYANKDVDKWLSNDFLHKVFIDPNAFVLIRFDDFDNKTQKADPYPVLISSKEAIDYRYTPKGILDYLLVESRAVVVLKAVGGKATYETAKRYTLYIKDYAYMLTEIKNISTQVIPEDAIKIGPKGNETFYYQVYEPKAGQVQAMRVGYITDPYTDDQTFVSPLECARSWFMKTVKTVAELDMTTTNHAFPQKIEYTEPCQLDISSGLCTTSNQKKSECNKCGGTGLCPITSSQDVKIMSLPRDKEDIIDLDKLLVYKYPPVDIIKWMDDYIDKVSVKIQKTVFNSETFTRDKVAKTATGENLDMQNVYDTLTPFAQQVSAMRIFIVTIVANFLDYGKGLIVKYSYPMDFKLKSLWELLQELKTTHESDAPGNVRQIITDDLMRVMLQDDEIELKRYKSKAIHYPYNGMTDKEIQEAIANNLITKDVQILGANFQWIFQQLEEEQAEKNKEIWFYDLTIEQQNKRIEEKVRQIKEQLEEDQVTAIGFQMPTESN